VAQQPVFAIVDGHSSLVTGGLDTQNPHLLRLFPNKILQTTKSGSRIRALMLDALSETNF
ncbi:MAG: hypothetical protein ABW153_10425, partial [Sedimenticola sp.]